MRLAIAGGGLAGVASAWYALQKGFEVTLFDVQGIGGGASGVATGLLHPFPGKSAVLSNRAEEGMQATKELLAISEEALQRPVASYTGIFRPAVTEQQMQDFQKQTHPSALWTSKEVPGLITQQGLWIASGITVFTPLYLQGLWKACEKKGAVFHKRPFAEDLSFDRIILAMGDKTPLGKIPVRTALGQTILCHCSNPLPFSMASHGYLAVTDDPNICQIGATYEHTPKPDPKKLDELIEKIALFYPEVKTFPILQKKVGMRVSPREGHLPIVAKLAPNTWIFTGLGSRGLLYHALYARELLNI